MEKFFYGDTFCADFDELADLLDIDDENVGELDDDWEVDIELSSLEPIFDTNADNIYYSLAAYNEYRIPEEFEGQETVIEALKKTIDFEKLKSLLPKLYYASGKFTKVTKSDLVEWFS